MYGIVNYKYMYRYHRHYYVAMWLMLNILIYFVATEQHSNSQHNTTLLEQ